MHKEAGLSADTQSPHSKMADAFDHEADLHEIHATAHETAAEECAKAAADSLNKLGDRLVPDNIHGVIPPYRPAHGAASRCAGPTGKKPNVPLEFEKLVDIEDD